MSDQTDTPQMAAASPPATTPHTLYAVSLLLTTPPGHAAAAVIAIAPDEALAMALRTADRDAPGVTQGGSVTPISSHVAAIALMRWLLIADPTALQRFAGDLLAALPTETIRDAWTILRESVETIETMRWSRNRRDPADAAPGGPARPAITA